ncbi:MAG: transcription antitermination protein NusB [Polyangiaceae bacterium]|nr:transcription antitermination protein NusB [Polyangiaceae bacterium]
MSDDARARAARVLARVWQDASYAAAALDTELSRPPALEPREAALATELTYGVLRTQGYLEARVAELARRGRGIDDALAQAHLLIGLYTLLFLERIPAFAAVSEAVGAISGRLGERPAGFANHVLRSAQKEVERAGRPTLEEAAVRGARGGFAGRCDGRSGGLARPTSSAQARGQLPCASRSATRASATPGSSASPAPPRATRRSARGRGRRTRSWPSARATLAGSPAGKRRGSFKKRGRRCSRSRSACSRETRSSTRAQAAATRRGSFTTSRGHAAGSSRSTSTLRSSSG